MVAPLLTEKGARTGFRDTQILDGSRNPSPDDPGHGFFFLWPSASVLMGLAEAKRVRAPTWRTASMRLQRAKGSKVPGLFVREGEA